MDAELKILEEQLSVERGTLDGLRGTLKKLDEKLQGDRAALAAMDKSRGELIADVRNMTVQLEHSREKLGRSRTERESNAATRELEELRKLIRDREDEVGKLTTDIDAARLGFETTENEHKAVADDLSAREGGIQAKVTQFDGERGTKKIERDHAAKALPPALYRKYEMIRQKKGVAIAQTSDGTCKACNMHLPPQLFHRLRREPMLDQCPSCFRIIYFVPPTAASMAPEKPEPKAEKSARG
jgi:predicted  nucleic acid-binding Zn-ribbon protein